MRTRQRMSSQQHAPSGSQQGVPGLSTLRLVMKRVLHGKPQWVRARQVTQPLPCVPRLPASGWLMEPAAWQTAIALEHASGAESPVSMQEATEAGCSSPGWQPACRHRQQEVPPSTVAGFLAGCHLRQGHSESGLRSALLPVRPAGHCNQSLNV